MAKHGSWWAGLVGLSLLVMALVGALRVYGALANRQVLLDAGLSAGRVRYLLVFGISQVLISLAGYLGMRREPPVGVLVAWLAVGLNIIAYWLERLLLWAPDQRGGNAAFMVALHGIWLLLLIAFTLKPNRKENDGSGD